MEDERYRKTKQKQRINLIRGKLLSVSHTFINTPPTATRPASAVPRRVSCAQIPSVI